MDKGKQLTMKCTLQRLGHWKGFHADFQCSTRLGESLADLANLARMWGEGEPRILIPCSPVRLGIYPPSAPLPRHPPSSATIVSCMAPPSVHTQPYIHMGTHRSHGVSHTAIKTQSIVKNSVLRLRRTANGNTVRAGPHETFG